MKLFYKFILVLVIAFLAPAIVLGIAASLSIRAVGVEASDESVRAVTDTERMRLLEEVQHEALNIQHFLSIYHHDVAHLKAAFERNHGRSSADDVPDLYPGRDKAGLPGYGFVHPEHKTYADFERRSGSCPWLPQRLVNQAGDDAKARQRLTGLLHEVMLVGPDLALIHGEHEATLDLAWIVLDVGITNVHPPYDLEQLIADRPEIVDLNESEQDYVRLLNPQNNPERAVRWLEPYLDAFKGVWMTSCVAPLYSGDEFLGTTGVDILLPTVIEQVLRFRTGSRGYAFLISSSGRPIALPRSGIDDMVWDSGHRDALQQNSLPASQQRWTPELVETLASIQLADAPNQELGEVIKAMKRRESGTTQVMFNGESKFVAYSPVPDPGWSLGVVIPAKEVAFRASGVQASIDEATMRAVNAFMTLAWFILAASIVAGFILHYLTIRPLVHLTRSVESVRWDTLQFPAPAQLRKDEVGQLYAKFAEMIRMLGVARDETTAKGAELEAANDKLTEANAGLRREVEERAKAQDALSREKELLAVTLASIGDGVITTDRHGRVVMINGVAEQLTGWSDSEARLLPLETVLPLIDRTTRAACESPASVVLQSGEAGGISGDTILIARDGTERIVADSGAPIRDASGQVIGVVLVFRDVTHRRRLEEEVIQAQKLETVRLLAAGIAHDFNNLLTAIMGNLSLAKHIVKPEELVHQRLGEAEKATLRARDLTVQLLTFSTGGAPLRKPITLGKVLREAASFALRGARASCQLDIPYDLWPVSADEGQIGQVLNNLILNADQAMPEGGVVTVAARNVKLSSASAVPLPAGHYVQVSVHDTGMGIPADRFARIFEPFFTTKPSGKGLGLAVCFSIIKRHDGHIEAECAPGGGTTFRFYLPVSEQPVATTCESARPPRRGTGRILIMDDDPSIRATLHGMLENLGYEVENTSDGEEAVQRYERARAEGKRFDAVILDLTVPGGMGGRDAARALARIDPTVRAVVSSGYSNDPIMAEFPLHGFKAAIAKPYDLNALAETVAKLLSEPGP